MEKIKIKINPWTISTIALLILIITLFFTGNISITGKFLLTKEQAGKKAIDFINKRWPSAAAKLVSVEDVGEIYKVLTSSQGQQIPVYVTKDGKYLILPQGIIDMTQEIRTEGQGEERQEIPKSDKPEVDLYIFSYCPAGTAALDTYAEVADFLKEYAIFKVRFFSDMHGSHEKQQNMIQECIQEEIPEKYWDYAKEYYEEVYQKCWELRSEECDKNASITLMERVNIDSEKIMNCVRERGEALYSNDKNAAMQFNLRYSPSLVVNNVSLGPNFDRSPEGIKSIVCSAFTTPPEKCSQSLSSSTSSSSGRC
jgi:protein-disulfide isomerase